MRYLLLMLFCFAPFILFAQDDLDFAEGDIETTLFDVYLGDSFQAEIIADYTDDWYLISDIRDLADQLTKIKDVDVLEQFFSGQVPHTQTLEGIGTVTLDLDTFRIVFDLHPEYLNAKSLGISDRIADPDKNFSIRNNVRFASSGELSERFRQALTHRNTISYGKFRGRVDGTIIRDADNDEYELTELSTFGVLGDYELSGGLLETQGQFFARSVNFAGISLQSSENLYLDRERLRGSLLEIFVPQRATVEFFRGNRLLSVQTLDFGLQEVDTSNFPQGSYDVEVIIRDGVEIIARETRFFTKSGLLGVRTRPIFSLSAGYLSDELDVFSIPVYESAIDWRAASFLQLRGSAYGSEDITIGSVDALGLYHDFIFGVGYTTTTEGDTAIHGNIGGSLGPLFWNFDYSETLTGFDEGTTQEILEEEMPFEDDPIFARDEDIDQFRVLTSNQTRISGDLLATFGPVKVGFSGNRSESLNNEDRFAYGPDFEWVIYQDVLDRLLFRSEYLWTDEGNRFLTYLGWQSRLGRWGYSSTVTHRGQSVGDEQSILNTISYDDKTLSGKGSRFRFSNEVRRRADEEEELLTNNRAEIDYGADHLRIDGFIRDNRTKEEGNTIVGANLESTVLIDSSGLTLTRPIDYESLLVAQVKSDSTSAPMEVIVNGSPKELIEPNEEVVIGLTPFRSYKVSIRPTEESDLIRYNSISELVTVFPGNVVRRRWEVEKVYIALGVIVSEDGQPIPWQRIRGVQEYVATEEDGSFQIELSGKESLSIESREIHCKLDIPSYETPEYFVDLGQIVCRDSRQLS